jgi:DNA-binding transcriptional MerR regulator
MDARMQSLFGEDDMLPETRGRKGLGMKAQGQRSGTMPDIERTVAGQNPDPLAGWTPEKHYYSIGEVAGLFEISPTIIRYWTTAFDLKVRTTAKGDRLYNAAMISELRAIYQMIKVKGLKISAARTALKSKVQNTVNELELRHRLLQLRNLLVDIKTKLKETP